MLYNAEVKILICLYNNTNKNNTFFHRTLGITYAYVSKTLNKFEELKYISINRNSKSGNFGRENKIIITKNGKKLAEAYLTIINLHNKNIQK